MNPEGFDEDTREHGEDWPSQAHSMIGVKRMDNIRHCLEKVIEENVPGDCIETGAWRGGACIFMRAILKAYGITDRNVWVADSFEGLPPPDAETYPADEGLDFSGIDLLAVSLEQVRDNFGRYGLLDDQVKFLKGWFRDTLPSAPIGEIAVLRLDGDLYESTMDALVSLYPRLAVGGFIIIDDYHIQACASAVEDYRSSNNITEKMVGIDRASVFWRRERSA